MTSTSKTVIRAAGLLMAANLLSRVLGLLRNTAIAAWFGQNEFTDVYTHSFKIPDSLFFLFAGGVFSAAFVPVMTRYVSKGEDEEAWKVLSIATTLIAIVIGSLVVLMMIFAHPLAALISPGFAPWQIDMMAHLTRILLPAQICFFLGALFMAAHFVKGRFWAPALGPLVYNVAIIIGGFIGWKLLGEERGIEGLTWGALIGAILGNLILPLVLLRGTGVRIAFSLNLKHPGIRMAGKMALPVLLGLSLPQVFSLVNGFFATLLGDGIVTALDRANHLMQAPLGIFAQAISMAIFPTLAALAARGERDELQRTFSRGIRSLWFLSFPLSFLMIALSEDIVRLLLQYGRFGEVDRIVTSQALAYYCLGLFAFSCLAILNRIFYAMQDNWPPAITGTLSTVVFVILNIILIKPFGHRGLALAGSLAAIFHLILTLAVLRKKADIKVEGLGLSFGKIAIASLACAAVAWAVKSGMIHLFAFISIPMKIQSLLTLMAATTLGGLAFLGLAKALRMEEMEYALGMVARRRKLL